MIPAFNVEPISRTNFFQPNFYVYVERCNEGKQRALLYVFASIRRNCVYSLPVNRVSRHILPFTNLLIMRDVVYARLISTHLRMRFLTDGFQRTKRISDEESADRWPFDFAILGHEPHDVVCRKMRNRIAQSVSVMAVYENMRLPRGLIPLTATKSACDRNFSSNIRARDFRFVGKFFSFFFLLLRLRISFFFFLFIFILILIHSYRYTLCTLSLTRYRFAAI